ncbi:MAG: site-specific integrase [Actinobacteria bacterium]|nr:site-specific integrase [Actinomycetota bacterium]
MAYIKKRAWPSGKISYIIGFRDQHGRWRERTAGPRRKDAEALLARVQREIAAGTYGREGDITFAEFLDGYLRTRDDLKESTLADYERTLRKHALGRIGKLPLREITPRTVQALLSDLEMDGVSPALRGKVLRYLKAALRHAVSLELIDRDPCRAIRAPRVKTKEQRHLAPGEVEALIQAAEAEVKPIIALAAYAGLRQGEILALTGADIDFAREHITVRRTYHYAHGFSDPKTPASRRVVPMIPTLKAILLEYYRSRGTPRPDDLVFSNRAGKPIDRRNLVNRGFERALEASGVPRIRFHDLRHTYASMNIEGGVDPKTLQAIMGHSSIRVTMDIYGHLYREAFQRAARALEAVVSGGPKVITLPKREGKGDGR